MHVTLFARLTDENAFLSIYFYMLHYNFVCFGSSNSIKKDFIELDRKINLLFSALEGKILKIFPIPDEPNNKWLSFSELDPDSFTGIDSLYVKNILPLYLGSLDNDVIIKDYTNSEKLLESIKGFQKKYGSEVLPTEKKIKAEIV